jgi:hypothetical protein
VAEQRGIFKAADRESSVSFNKTTALGHQIGVIDQIWDG